MKPCSCGDRSRKNINHRVHIPCYTFIGSARYDINEDGTIGEAWAARRYLEPER